MIAAAQWARTKNIPYLGTCFGFQIASIEYARNVCSIPDATSSEFDPRASDPVIIPMEEIDQEVLGGTMRLGLQPTIFQPGTEWSKLRALYDRAREVAGHQPDTGEVPVSPHAALSHDPSVVLERHRHRYEINPRCISKFSEHGLKFIGKDDKGLRMEIFELKNDQQTHSTVVFNTTQSILARSFALLRYTWDSLRPALGAF
jgi:CTP synthase